MSSCPSHLSTRVSSSASQWFFICSLHHSWWCSVTCTQGHDANVRQCLCAQLGSTQVSGPDSDIAIEDGWPRAAKREAVSNCCPLRSFGRFNRDTLTWQLHLSARRSLAGKDTHSRERRCAFADAGDRVMANVFARDLDLGVVRPLAWQRRWAAQKVRWPLTRQVPCATISCTSFFEVTLESKPGRPSGSIEALRWFFFRNTSTKNSLATRDNPPRATHQQTDCQLIPRSVHHHTHRRIAKAFFSNDIEYRV